MFLVLEGSCPCLYALHSLVSLRQATPTCVEWIPNMKTVSARLFYPTSLHVYPFKTFICCINISVLLNYHHNVKYYPYTSIFLLCKFSVVAHVRDRINVLSFFTSSLYPTPFQVSANHCDFCIVNVYTMLKEKLSFWCFIYGLVIKLEKG